MPSGKAEIASKTADRSTILISANAFWNIAHFRIGLVEALAEEGHQIIVAAPNPDQHWAAERGVQAVDIAINRSGVNPFDDVLLLLNYCKLNSKFRPKYFLGYTAKPNIYGSIAARFSGVATLPNVSGLGTAFMSRGLLSALVGVLYRIAFRDCPIVFFQNPDDRDLFVDRKIIRPDQARLVPGSGVDLAHFAPVPASDGIRFLFIGRLLGDKGVREFVEAAKLLGADHPDWRFELLGPLDEGNRTAIRREELGQWVAEGAVEYVGNAKDVRPFIASATAVVLPSYREGLPRSLLEAAAMARPLIATDVPGNRHIVNHGANGLLCKVRDPNALAEAMKTMGTMDRNQRDRMGLAGRNLVERDYGEGKVIQAYLDAMAQLRRSPKSLRA